MFGLDKNDSAVFAVVCIILFVFWIWLIYYFIATDRQDEKYRLTFPGRYRTSITPHPGSFGWIYGAHPKTCDNNYKKCMEKCRVNPRIGCPGQCQEEKEYCQEYAM